MVWVAVPIKPHGQAKSRLAGFLPGPVRTALFKAMLYDVLTAVSACSAVERILIVTSVQRGAALASEFNADLLEDDGLGGLNGACQKAAQHLVKQQADTLFLLHGDLPLILPAHVNRILQLHQAKPALTLVPDIADAGTNGLLVSPPGLIRFCYGSNSFRKHLEAAKELGIEANIVRIPEIGLDVDEPSDLKNIADKLTIGTRTHTLLKQIDWTNY